MTPLPNLTELSSEAKDALIAELWKKVQALEAQLEAQSKVLKKTAKNSSLPPSQGFKPNVKPMQTAGVTPGKPVSGEPEEDENSTPIPTKPSSPA